MKNNQSLIQKNGLILPSEFLSPDINDDNKILEKEKGLEKKPAVFKKVFQEKEGKWELKKQATPNDKKELVYHCATEYGNLYFKKNDYPQAVSYHEIAYHAKPNDDDSALNLAGSYHSLAKSCFKVAKELAVQCATKAGDLYHLLLHNKETECAQNNLNDFSFVGNLAIVGSNIIQQNTDQYISNLYSNFNPEFPD